MGLATALPSATIRSGRPCIDFEQSAHSAQLKFATGETDIADVVIGADSLQKHVVEPSTPEYSGSRTPGFDSDRKGSGMAKEARQIWMGDGKHFMVYPVRSGRLFNVWEPSFSDTWSASYSWHGSPTGHFGNAANVS
jgi:salicylate hydroxylase